MTRAIRLALLAWMLSTPIASAETITIRAADWCPYVCDPASDRPGYLIDIAVQAFAAAGHEVDFQFLPYARAIAEVRRGVFNAVAGSGRDDTPDFILSKPMGVHVAGLAMRKGSGFRYEGIKSLERIRLTTTVGVASWGGGLDEYIAANKDNPARIEFLGGEKPLPVSIRKLLLGRIDAIADSALVLRWAATELGVADRMEFIHIAENDDVYYAFSPAIPGSTEHLRILEEGVARMRESGELARIMARYGLTDWAP